MTSELVLIKRQHQEVGAAPYYHEWVEGERVKADSRGRPNPRMWDSSWRRWVCNNGDCGAWALVSDQAIQRLLEAEEVSS